METFLQGSVNTEGNQQQVKAGQHSDDSNEKESEDSKSQNDETQMLGSNGNGVECIAGWVPPQSTASNQIHLSLDASSQQFGISNVSGQNVESVQGIESSASSGAAKITVSGAQDKQSKDGINAEQKTSDTRTVDSIKPASDNQTESQTTHNDGKNSDLNKSAPDDKSVMGQKVDQIPIKSENTSFTDSDKESEKPGRFWDPDSAVKDSSETKITQSLKTTVDTGDKSAFLQVNKIADSMQVNQINTDRQTYHVTAAQSVAGKSSVDLSDQIVQAARIQLSDSGGNMYLRLDPPHLGMLHMNVSSHEGLLTAHIYTSTESARQMLESDISSLREMMQKAGINVDSINISMGDKPPGDWNPQNNSQSGWGHTPDKRGNRYSGFMFGAEGIDISQDSSSPAVLAGLFDFLA